jgi:hypothetical protein
MAINSVGSSQPTPYVTTQSNAAPQTAAPSQGPVDQFVSSPAAYGAAIGAPAASNLELINQIANAPLFNKEEEALMSKLPPEQQAMMKLQAKKQRESLLTQTATQLINMKQEMLKQIAGNLRG